MNLKVLALELWMTEDYLLEDNTLVPTEPVYNRDGLYCKGEVSWFEVQGKAFKFDHKGFKFRLDVLTAGEFSTDEVLGLKAITKTKFATKQQHYWKGFRDSWEGINKVGRDTRLWLNRLDKEHST